MFYNFLLHPTLRPYAGVDISHVRTEANWELERIRRWEHFSRNYFGQTDSPGRSIQMGTKGKLLAMGDRHDPENPYQWDSVSLNLLGSAQYDAMRPWVSKLRKDGKIASESSVYVDDGRHMGHDQGACWRTTRRFCSFKGWLGVQDATRKRTRPTTLPGLTAGSIIHTEKSVLLTVTKE
jgi:hypothetical protein